MTTPTSCHTDPNDLAENARGALERVCSGKNLDPASRYYSPSFVDHVNDLEFRGLAGTEKSIELYRRIFSDMAITVEDQTVQGDRVTSRFVVTGTSYGRRVRFNGITMSRFENGLIVEDWSVTDTLGMLLQLGLWRSLPIGVKSLGTLKAASSPSPAGASQNFSERAST